MVAADEMVPQTISGPEALMSLPEFPVLRAMAEQARQRTLGEREAVYRRLRPVRGRVLWAAAAADIIAACVLGGARQHAIAVVLVILFPVGLAVYRYGAVPELLALHANGLVHGRGVRARGAAVRAVHWAEIAHVWQSPGSVILRLDPDLELTGFSRQEEMAALVDTRLQPRALARAQDQLSETGEASFPAPRASRTRLVVTRTGLTAVRYGKEQSAAWDQVDSHVLDGGRLRVYLARNTAAARPPLFGQAPLFRPVPLFGQVPLYGQTSARSGPASPWFDERVADAVAADGLIAEANPAASRAGAAELVEGNVTAAWQEARRRVSRTRRVLAVQGALLTLLLAGFGVLAVFAFGVVQQDQYYLSLGLGLHNVCGGAGAPGAAPYAGDTHPVDFEVDAGFANATMNMSDSDGALGNANQVGDFEPPAWVPGSVADVQLVACVTSQPSLVQVTTCSYEQSFGGDAQLASAAAQALALLYQQSYTITLREARTGKVVAGPILLTGEDDSCPDSILASAGQTVTAYTSLTGSQVRQAIGRYVQG